MRGIIFAIIAVFLILLTFLGARAETVTYFNDSLTAQNLTYSSAPQNITRWLDIPKGSNVTEAYINLSGFSFSPLIENSYNFTWSPVGSASGAPVNLERSDDGNWSNYGYITSATCGMGTCSYDVYYSFNMSNVYAQAINFSVAYKFAIGINFGQVKIKAFNRNTLAWDILKTVSVPDTGTSGNTSYFNISNYINSSNSTLALDLLTGTDIDFKSPINIYEISLEINGNFYPSNITIYVNKSIPDNNLHPILDTKVEKQYGGTNANTNYVNGTPLIVKVQSGITDFSYLKFNFTNIDLTQYDYAGLNLNAYGAGCSEINISFHRVYNPDDFDASNITFANQPCWVGNINEAGGSAYFNNSAKCNLTEDFKLTFAGGSSYGICAEPLQPTYNISIILDQNHSNTVVVWGVQVRAGQQSCSNGGVNIGSIECSRTPLTPYINLVKYPSNSTIIYQNLTQFDSTNQNTRAILNASVISSYFADITPVQFLFESISNGILQLSDIYFNYGIPSGIATIKFNETYNWLYSSSTGYSTRSLYFTINNSGTYDATNCTFYTTGSLNAYVVAPMFNVTQGTTTTVNVSFYSVPDGTYYEYLNARCLGNSDNDTFTTSQFGSQDLLLWSIATPVVYSGGSGGGGGLIIISKGTGNFVLKTEYSSTSYTLILAPNQKRTINVVASNLGTADLKVDMSCKSSEQSSVCSWLKIMKTEISLPPNADYQETIPIEITIPENTPTGDYLLSIAGEDVSGGQQILPVTIKVTNTFGIVNLLISKLSDNYVIDLSSINPNVKPLSIPKFIPFIFALAITIGLNLMFIKSLWKRAGSVAIFMFIWVIL